MHSRLLQFQWPRLLVFGFALVVPVSAQAEGLTGLLRSVTNAVTPQKQPEKQQGLTTTMGVRGMDDGDQIAGGPASEDYLMMEGWAVDPKTAAAAAKTRSLVARNVELKAGVATAGGKK